jgi:hypothetical protein
LHRGIGILLKQRDDYHRRAASAIDLAQKQIFGENRRFGLPSQAYGQLSHCDASVSKIAADGTTNGL